MSGCCVYGCTNRYSTGGLKFYRIPRGPRPFQSNRRRLWLQAIKRVDWNEDIIKNARVCSAHFISGEASLDSSSPDLCHLCSCTQNKARTQMQRWTGTIGKGGELTLQQINVLLLKLQNKNAAWIIVLVRKLEALGYKPILFYGKPKRASNRWAADRITHLPPTPTNKTILDKMRRAYEFLLTKESSTAHQPASETPTAEQPQTLSREQQERPATEQQPQTLSRDQQERPAKEQQPQTLIREQQERPAIEQQPQTLSREQQESPATEQQPQTLSREQQERPATEQQPQTLSREQQETSYRATTTDLAESSKRDQLPSNNHRPLAESSKRPATEQQPQTLSREQQERQLQSNNHRPLAESSKETSYRATTTDC
ncbi:Reticulocyte-binding protein 2 like a [Dissostichus eleginoides]|uniref:Reticulocyte-binding protein 2 like a n=1 Tax=Dissostichus eleginoides TaxID=100907 RepID=A0AAD9FDT5_DISEL|nr:Reticulocyte-binding protein 2 like a [Dissostichus eleginoides]